MRKTSTPLISLRTLQWFRYVLPVIYLIKNWSIFLLNWAGIKNTNATYHFRDKTTIKTTEGIDAVTIAGIFIRNQYRKLSGLDKIIIDIGANIGVFSIFAARQCKNSKIFAYEPMPDNFSCLLDNIKSNSLQNTIMPFQFGVCGKSGVRKLYINTSPQHSIFGSQKPERQHIKIQCVSLEEIFNQNKIEECDVLKIDCEGAEYEILYNAHYDVLKKIKKIILECHNIPSIKNYNKKSMRKFLVNKGFEIIIIEDELATSTLCAINKELSL